MKWLFVWAHPDDETVGAGGTMRMLVERGHEVRVVLATDGAGGEVKGGEEKLGRVEMAKLRRQEFEEAVKVLKVEGVKVLDFEDGEITNKLVWGELTQAVVEEIKEYKPDAVVTFDHSGWYYHLDHVAVSLAVTRAVNKLEQLRPVLMFCLFQTENLRDEWGLVFERKMPVTHVVKIDEVVKDKVEALRAHKSQAIGLADDLEKGEQMKECFQLVDGSDSTRRLLEEVGIFEEVI